jgi:hypothetical protein
LQFGVFFSNFRVVFDLIGKARNKNKRKEKESRTVELRGAWSSRDAMRWTVPVISVIRWPGHSRSDSDTFAREEKKKLSFGRLWHGGFLRWHQLKAPT